jgi:hypothetical protein
MAAGSCFLTNHHEAKESLKNLFYKNYCNYNILLDIIDLRLNYGDVIVHKAKAA